MSTVTQQAPLTKENLVEISKPKALVSPPPHKPQPFANPINKKLYNSSLLSSIAASSTDSLETTSSSASTIKISSTASSPSLPNYFQPSHRIEEPVDATLSLPVPPQLLRKKSGELVKSSLKLSSLIPKAMSTTQLNSNKSVRFASRLANIKMFDGLESPSAVSSIQNTPIHSPPEPEGFSDDEEDDDDFQDFDFANKKSVKLKKKKNSQRSDYFQWNWNGEFPSNSNTQTYSPAFGIDGDLTSDTSSDDELNYWYNASHNSNSNNNNSNNKKKYRIDSSDVHTHRQASQPVVLKSIKLLEENNNTYLYGLIDCQNLAFEKHLMIKLTLNNWETNLNFSHKIISFLKSIGHSNIDQFQFKIPLSELLDIHRTNSTDKAAFDSSINVQMCVKYTVDNQVYWDNNSGRNYHIVLKSNNSIRTYNYSKSTSALSSMGKTNKDLDDSFPQFDELVNKLIHFQNSSAELETAGLEKSTSNYKKAVSGLDEDYVFSKPLSPKKSGLHSRYNNINDELDHLPRTSKSVAASATAQFSKPAPTRPPLMKQSFSASDVLQRPKQKYSQNYRSKQQQQQPEPAKRASSSENLKFNSLSYTDLLANYCFSGGATNDVSTSLKGAISASAPTSPSGSNNSSSTNISMMKNDNVFGASFASSCSPASTFHSFSDSIHT